MGAAFSRKNKQPIFPLTPVEEPQTPSTPNNKVMPFADTHNHLVIPALTNANYATTTRGALSGDKNSLGGNTFLSSRFSHKSAPVTTAGGAISIAQSNQSKKLKKENKKPPRHITQLLENDLVNIVYVEPGSKPPSKVQDLIQQDKFVVVPKAPFGLSGS